jgi:hypothetical protein
VRGHRDPLDRRVVVDAGGEHQLLVGVLVVGDEHGAAGGEWDDADVVAVVAELALRGRRGLRERVEGGGVGGDRVAPADQDVVGVAARDRDVVADVRGDRREVGERVAAVAPARRAAGAGVAAAAADGLSSPPRTSAPAPTPPAFRTERRARAPSTSEEKWGLSEVFGTGLSQALPHR